MKHHHVVKWLFYVVFDTSKCFFTHAVVKTWYVIVDQTSNKLDYIPEKHLFPHVKFPRNVRISVIFLAGPAVELSLNDLLLNWQLSGHWKHTHTDTHTSSIPFFSVLRTYVRRVQHTWRRSWVGLDCSGNFESCLFFIKGGWLLLTLIRKILALFELVCDRRRVNV